MFPKQASPPPTGLKFYKCACGLVQVWGSGACLDSSCKKSLVGCPQVAERDVPKSQDVKRDERAQQVNESMRSAKDKIAQVFGSVAPRAVPDAPPATQEPARSADPRQREIPLALELDLSALSIALEKRGVVQRKSAKPLTLAQIARWTPEQRRSAAIWCERMSDRPAFLENGVDDDRSDPDDERVVHDEEGDVRTVNEMREKHGLAETQVLAIDARHVVTKDMATTIDATSPELRAVLEPDTKTRRRVVKGEASKVSEAARRDPGDLVIEKLLPADTLTVTWGEEKFTPIPGSYSTCSVGPFSTTISVMPGESNLDAFRRANEFLAGLAKEEKDRKLREFTAQLREMTAQVRR